MPEHFATVDRALPLTDSILQLCLKPDRKVNYSAGHYLELVFDGKHYPFSIANAPLGGSLLELHIRHSQGEPASQQVVRRIREAERLQFIAPCGRTTVERLVGREPLIFVAGGTGFAPIKAMIESLLADGCQREIHLYASAKKQSDLYMDDLALKWARHMPQFSYSQCLSTDVSSLPVAQRVISDLGAMLLSAQIIIAGPFPMVYHLRDAFVASGVCQTKLLSDAFDFEEK